MPQINENKLAAAVTKAEGNKVSVNISQVREVNKETLDRLALRPFSEVAALLEKRKAKMLAVRAAQLIAESW